MADPFVLLHLANGHGLILQGDADSQTLSVVPGSVQVGSRLPAGGHAGREEGAGVMLRRHTPGAMSLSGSRTSLLLGSRSALRSLPPQTLTSPMPAQAMEAVPPSADIQSSGSKVSAACLYRDTTGWLARALALERRAARAGGDGGESEADARAAEGNAEASRDMMLDLGETCMPTQAPPSRSRSRLRAGQPSLCCLLPFHGRPSHTLAP